MIAFQVDDMTCNHCVGTITRVVKEADADARVRIDLARHRVEIDAARLDAAQLRAAIAEAGYTPLPV
jgi:copper chaperone